MKSKQELTQVWAVEGCLFFIRTSDLEAVNFFDENVFLYFEEDILANKLKRLGRKEGICKVKFIHDHDQETPRERNSKSILMNASREYYLDSYEFSSRGVKVLYKILKLINRIEWGILRHIKKLLRCLFALC